MIKVVHTARADVGTDVFDGPVFWANRNAGVRYVRCVVPARAIGGRVDNIKEATDEGRFHMYTGPHVFQIPKTRFEYSRMLEAKEAGCLVAAEFDDDYTRWDAGHASGASKGRYVWTKTEKQARDQWSPNVEMVRACAALADTVIVTTPALRKAYLHCNDSVAICRNSVDPADWPEPQRLDDAPFRVMFAAAHNPHDFSQVKKAMVWLAAQDDAEAIVMGGNIDWPGVIHIPWVNDDLGAVRAFMAAVAPDVGLRPLEPTRFARGKSDLKILEYAMSGAMSIVAPYEPYKHFPQWQGLVRYARNGLEFVEQVRWAYENRETANRLAEQTRELVLAERTIRSEAHSWVSALRSSKASHSTV